MIEEPIQDGRPLTPVKDREKYHYVWVPENDPSGLASVERFRAMGFEVVEGVPSYRGEVLMREPIERWYARRKVKEERNQMFLRGSVTNVSTGETKLAEPIRVKGADVQEALGGASVIPSFMEGGETPYRTAEDLDREASLPAQDPFEGVFE